MEGLRTEAAQGSPGAEGGGDLTEGLREQAEAVRSGGWEGILLDLREVALDLVAYLPILLLALLVFLLFLWLSGLVGRWDRLYRRVSGNRFVRDLVRQAVRLAIVLVGALFALEVMNATAVAGAVLGTAGVIGLALGFAFRDLAENQIAGVLMSLRQPFEPNDHVVIEGHEGKVVRLTSRATILMTLDGNHLRIPNATVLKSVMLNYTRNPRRRLAFTLGIGPAEDLVRALTEGASALGGVDGVLGDPEPRGQIEEVGDSWVTVRFFAWVDQRESDFARVRSEAIRVAKQALEVAGIEMPEPSYRLSLTREEAAEEMRPEVEGTAPRTVPGPGGTAAGVDAEGGAADVIDRQIAEERAASPGRDLLDPEAPRE